MGLRPLLPGSRPGQFMARRVHSWKGPNSPDKMCPRPCYSEATPSLYVYLCTPEPLPTPNHHHTHTQMQLHVYQVFLLLDVPIREEGTEPMVVYKGLETPRNLVRDNYILAFILCNLWEVEPPGFNYNPIRDRQAATLAHRLVGNESLEHLSPNAAVFSLSNSHS